MPPFPLEHEMLQVAPASALNFLNGLRTSASVRGFAFLAGLTAAFACSAFPSSDLPLFCAKAGEPSIAARDNSTAKSTFLDGMIFPSCYPLALLYAVLAADTTPDVRRAGAAATVGQPRCRQTRSTVPHDALSHLAGKMPNDRVERPAMMAMPRPDAAHDASRSAPTRC